MSSMLVVEQRAFEAAPPWMLERHGRRTASHDNDSRLRRLREGLMRHARVRSVTADSPTSLVEHTLAGVHEPAFLDALLHETSTRATLMPELAAPGVSPDTPVSAGVVATALESVRTAVTAAASVAAGTRYAYALSRPPGHHAGPGWLGGYCYLNTAAAATHVLRERGAGPVGILDLDFHYPNGTSAIAAEMSDVALHSLHASTVKHFPWHAAKPRTPRERLVEFGRAPSARAYLGAIRASLDALVPHAEVLVISLGYDTVTGDPHGTWRFSPEIFTQVGMLLAAARRPLCIIQEGGYATSELSACSFAFAAGLLDERGGD